MTSESYHRTLGWLESFTVDMSVVVMCICQFESSTRFDKQRLEAALHQCIDRHHSLRLKIRTTVKPYQFYFVTQPYLSPIYLETKSKDEWQKIVHDELNTPFDLGSDETSLFKLIILYPTDATNDQQFLLIKYHHAVGDGTSGMVILNTLLSYYFGTDPSPSPLPHLAESETLAFPCVNSEDERKTQEVIDNMLAYKRQWKPTIPYEAGKGHNAIRYSHGTAENMAKLLDRCRQEKVTIGSVLIASIYFAIAELVKETWLHDPQCSLSNFHFDLDVNLRQRYASPLPRHEHVGLHVSMMDFGVGDVSLQTKFWSFCRVIHEELQTNLAADKHFLYLRAGRLCPVDAQVEEQTKRYDGRINDLNVSNIGPYPFRREFEGFKLKHYYCVSSNACPVAGTAIILVCSINSLDYVLLYETDTAWKYDAEWSFENFINNNN